MKVQLFSTIKCLTISCVFFLSAFFGLDINAQISYDVQFTHDGKIVFGTFTVPSDAGKFPTIIIVPGSGSQDRYGTFTFTDSTAECLYPELFNETLQPYKQLAEALVDSGYAVLLYEKLEYTYIPALLGPLTFHKLWLPAESAIDYLKTRTEVDTSCITLIGHSEGSYTIPYIALGRSDVKALISIAGARRPIDSLLAYQIVNIAQTCDDNTFEAQETADQILEYYHLVRVNHGIGLPPLFGVPATVWYDYLLATEAVSENYNLNDLPTLFLGFELDINVPPVELMRLQNEVTITDDFWSLPGIIHYMTPFNDPNVSEMLTDTIVHWLRQQQCIATSVTEGQVEAERFKVYPNPFVHEVNISFAQELNAKINYTIRDILGTLVISGNGIMIDAHTQRLDLHFLPNGLYVLQVEMGEKHYRSTIVKI